MAARRNYRGFFYVGERVAWTPAFGVRGLSTGLRRRCALQKREIAANRVEESGRQSRRGLKKMVEDSELHRLAIGIEYS